MVKQQRGLQVMFIMMQPSSKTRPTKWLYRSWPTYSDKAGKIWIAYKIFSPENHKQCKKQWKKYMDYYYITWKKQKYWLPVGGDVQRFENKNEMKSFLKKFLKNYPNKITF